MFSFKKARQFSRVDKCDILMPPAFDHGNLTIISDPIKQRC